MRFHSFPKNDEVVVMKSAHAFHRIHSSFLECGSNFLPVSPFQSIKPILDGRNLLWIGSNSRR